MERKVVEGAYVHVVLFGTVPLATWVAEQLDMHPRVRLVAAVCADVHHEGAFDHHGLPYQDVPKWARKKEVPILKSAEEAVPLVADVPGAMGVSVRYHKILKSGVLEAFSGGVLNLHGGVLPGLRGVNSANHAILEGLVETAGTIHFLDEGVDTGDIVHREYVSIDPRDTAWDVFRKTQMALMAGFVRVIDRVGRGETLERIPQREFIERGEAVNTYRRRDLEAWRRVRTDFSAEKVDRRARAFTFPGHPPAYLEIGGRKFPLAPSSMRRD